MTQVSAIPEQLREATGRLRVCYEIYPDMRLKDRFEPITWFELALHAETEEYRPPAHRDSIDARFVLGGLADFLIGQLREQAPFHVTQSETNTLHPTLDDQGRVRISRTLSLVFSKVGHYTVRAEPRLLTRLREELDTLGISTLQ